MILIDSLVFKGVIILYTLTCKKYHTVKTVSKSNRQIVKRCSLDIPNTQIHDLSPSWQSTCASSGGDKIVYGPTPHPVLSEYNVCNYVMRISD